MITVTDLRCEYFKNPIGIDVQQPRISWKIQSDQYGVKQSAYQIQVAEDHTFKQMIWDSDKVVSDQSIHVEIADLKMESRKRYYYRVKVWNQENISSDWSEPAFWETGILQEDEWVADWVSAPKSIESKQCPILKKSFLLNEKVKYARVYVTALGLYELHLNGQRVGKDYFTPGWTSYEKRLQYQTYDVTDLLKQGLNHITALLGNGWYKGYLGWEGNRELYGDRLALLLQMHIVFENGEEFIIKSDESWEATGSPILMSEIYHGEIYDARLEEEMNEWEPVEILPQTKSILVAQENNPVRKIEEIKPIQLIITPKGEKVLDFGQNMVGWVRFSVQGEEGKTVKLQHAEVLDKDGNFYTENLRRAKQTITYTLKGGEKETYEPTFTFQGFRYVKLIGFDNNIHLDDFTGVVLHTAMERTGGFECSDPLVNQLHHNILWGLKGNFLDIPTDCPQRDERLGWTGDAQVFIRTATYLKNVAPFFTKWLRDLAADQYEDGAVPFIVPNIQRQDKGNDESPTPFSASVWGRPAGSAAWGDAAVICPWTIYKVYGDKRLLEEQYSSMKAWVEYIRKQGDNEYLWNTGFHFGDWLALDSKPDSYVGATDKDFIATAYYAYSVHLLYKTAEVIGKKDEAKHYHELYQNIVNAFREEFITPSGRLAVPTQTAHVLALMFNLVDGKAKERTVARLVELIEEENYHLTTGFVGTPYLNHVLSDNGHNDIAYKLLLQKDYPSWLYQVTKGATTVWEHWDGIKEDGSFWSPNMNSFNHYAYGAIGDWLYQKVVGIDVDENYPAYKKSIIKPLPGQGLTYARGSIETMYGTLTSGWKLLEDNKIEMEVIIPPNTEAELHLPHSKGKEVLVNDTPLHEFKEIYQIHESGDIHVLVGSGSYRFVY